MTEDDILYEKSPFWVARVGRGKTKTYEARKDGNTHSSCLCVFEGNADGLSLAKAYVDYKHKRYSQSIAA
jgi:hypothetical protein